ncbi:MAG: hypothetical protein AABX17_04020, partial [Nanoarchaeota archaeon]
STNRVKFTFLDSADSTRHYTAKIHCDGTWTPTSNNFDRAVNIRDVITGGGYVDLPGVMNCPSGTVYGTVEVNPQFNRLVSTKSGAGNGTNSFEGGQIMNYLDNTNVVATANVGNYIASYDVTRTDTTGGVSVVTSNMPDQSVSVTNIPINGIMGSNQVNVTYMPILEQIVSTAGTNGTINPAGTNNIPYGGSTNFYIAADSDYKIDQVKTNGVNVAGASGLDNYNLVLNNITSNMTVDSSSVVKRTTNGIPFTWLTQHGITNKTDSVETNNADSDVYNNLAEYITGTDPTNETSFFSINDLRQGNSFDLEVTPTFTDNLYTAYGKTNIADFAAPWSEISNAVGTGVGGVGSHLVFELPDNSPVKFYRVGVRKR